MRPSLLLAVLVLLVGVAVITLIGVTGISDTAAPSPGTTDTTILEEGPVEGMPVEQTSEAVYEPQTGTIWSIAKALSGASERLGRPSEDVGMSRGEEPGVFLPPALSA